MHSCMNNGDEKLMIKIVNVRSISIRNRPHNYYSHYVSEIENTTEIGVTVRIFLSYFKEKNDFIQLLIVYRLEEKMLCGFINIYYDSFSVDSTTISVRKALKTESTTISVRKALKTDKL